MANDLVGLLTGISGTQQPMQPMQPIAGTPGFAGMFGAQQAQGLASGLGRIARQGAPTNQERMQEAVSKLDLGSVDGLTTLAKLQQIQGDLAGASQTVAKIKQLQDSKTIATKEAAEAAVEEQRYQDELALKKREVAINEGKLKDDGPLPTQAQKAIVSLAEQRSITPESKQALVEGLKSGVVTKISQVDDYVEAAFKPADVYTKEVSRTIEQANDLYEKGNRGASEAERLLNSIATSGALSTRGGVFATITEGVKEFAGIRDDVSFLRTRATKEINTAIVGELPPGVASDTDIAIFSKGFPNPDTATFQEITEYLEAAKRINQIVANDSAFKNYHISTNIKNKRTANLEGFIPASRKFHRGKERLDTLYNDPNITPEQKNNLLDAFQEAFGVIPVEYN